MQKQPKEASPLVQSVRALDEHFADLERLSRRIGETGLESDSDFEQTQRLLGHFAEVGQKVSDEVMALSRALNDARASAEENARKVAKRAEEFQEKQGERQKKLDQFQLLGNRVHEISASLNALKRPEGETPSEADRAQISERLSDVENKIRPLIEEAQQIKDHARVAKMKNLERNADSLNQTLLAVSKKIGMFQATGGEQPRLH